MTVSPTTALTCTYRLLFNPDTLAKYAQTDYMSLVVSGEKSVFQSRKQIAIDSIVSVVENMPHTQENLNMGADFMTKLPQPTFEYSIYKNRMLHKVIYVDAITFKKYSYEEPTDLFSWQINSAKESIDGYPCQQAITTFRGRKFTAWFTRQIPVSDGPYKFYGLPGLIIKISDQKNQYVFDLVKLTQNTNPITIDIPNGVINTTREEFTKATADFNANAVERAIAMGVQLKSPEAAKQNLREKEKHRNNPLELE